jgi:hypothetical protein
MREERHGQAGSKVDIRKAIGLLDSLWRGEYALCMPAKGHARIQGVETTVQYIDGWISV